MKKPHWLSEGEDPDYRFSLANERTFLAWIRTALALLAGGILVDQLGAQYPHLLVLATATLLTVSGAGLCVVAYFRWRANEIAMRHKRSLRPSVFLYSASLLLALTAGLGCVLVWV